MIAPIDHEQLRQLLYNWLDHHVLSTELYSGRFVVVGGRDEAVATGAYTPDVMCCFERG